MSYLLHWLCFKHVSPQRPDYSDVFGRGKLFRQVASVDGRVQIVDNPIRINALHALIECTGHLEAETPLMHARVDLMRFIFGAFCRKEVLIFSVKPQLCQDWLRSYGVCGAPSDHKH